MDCRTSATSVFKIIYQTYRSLHLHIILNIKKKVNITITMWASVIKHTLSSAWLSLVFVLAWLAFLHYQIQFVLPLEQRSILRLKCQAIYWIWEKHVCSFFYQRLFYTILKLKLWKAFLCFQILKDNFIQDLYNDCIYEES